MRWAPSQAQQFRSARREQAATTKGHGRVPTRLAGSRSLRLRLAPVLLGHRDEDRKRPLVPSVDQPRGEAAIAVVVIHPRLTRQQPSRVAARGAGRGGGHPDSILARSSLVADTPIGSTDSGAGRPRPDTAELAPRTDAQTLEQMSVMTPAGAHPAPASPAGATVQHDRVGLAALDDDRSGLTAALAAQGGGGWNRRRLA